LNPVLEFIIFHLPWWLDAIAGVLIVGALAYFLHLDSRHLIEVAALILVAVFSQKLAQDGWKAKERKDMADANKAIDRAQQARQQQDNLNAKNLRAPDRDMRP
jgi:hypothetical protein